MRFRSLILSVLPPVVERSAAVYPPRVYPASASRCCYYYSRLHRSPSPRLLLNDRARALESLYPRCVIAAHNHYRVESSLERNKCARSRSRCVRSVPSPGAKFTMAKNVRSTFKADSRPFEPINYKRPTIIYARGYKCLIADCDDGILARAFQKKPRNVTLYVNETRKMPQREEEEKRPTQLGTCTR